VDVLTVLAALVEIYIVILIVRALLSWFPAAPGSSLERATRTMDLIIEPVLRPIRRVLPPVRAGGMGIDLSFLVLVIGLQLIVVPLLRR
jgi:YggT family protein